jgi:trans-aconitate methyltransferase
MSDIKKKDDYDWTKYHETYVHCRQRDGVDDCDKFVEFTTENGEFKIINKDRQLGCWNELFYQIGTLRPKSVFECGCGPGHNLVNVLRILPDARIMGCDISETQIHGTGKFYNIPPHITERLKALDFAQVDAWKHINSTFDFIYTHAVIMHLEESRAREFIKNMILLSNKYVLMLENTTPPHYLDYTDAVKQTCADLKIPFKLERTSKYAVEGTLLILEKA